VDKFEYRRGYKFRPMRQWWIRSDHASIADQAPYHPYPSAYDRNDQTSWLDAGPSDAARNRSAEPTLGRLAEKLQDALEKVRKVMKIAKEPISLEKRQVAMRRQPAWATFIEDKMPVCQWTAAIQENHLKETTTAVLAVADPREGSVFCGCVSASV